LPPPVVDVMKQETSA
jgi:hypothetical protein